MLVPTFGICKLETQEDFLKWFFFNVDSDGLLTDGEIQETSPVFTDGTGGKSNEYNSFSEQLKRAFDREICQKSHTLKKEVDGITETEYKNLASNSI